MQRTESMLPIIFFVNYIWVTSDFVTWPFLPLRVALHRIFGIAVAFRKKPAVGAQTDKANATALYMTDKNVRAIDNNYYTVTKEAEARVRSRKTDKARHDTCNYLAMSRDNIYFRP